MSVQKRARIRSSGTEWIHSIYFHLSCLTNRPPPEENFARKWCRNRRKAREKERGAGFSRYAIQSLSFASFSFHCKRRIFSWETIFLEHLNSINSRMNYWNQNRFILFSPFKYTEAMREVMKTVSLRHPPNEFISRFASTPFEAIEARLAFGILASEMAGRTRIESRSYPSAMRHRLERLLCTSFSRPSIADGLNVTR